MKPKNLTPEERSKLGTEIQYRGDIMMTKVLFRMAIITGILFIIDKELALASARRAAINDLHDYLRSLSLDQITEAMRPSDSSDSLEDDCVIIASDNEESEEEA